MPPRYSYWTIIAGGLPTAFRAAQKDELLPTFTQIKAKHADAELKWFARGRLWDSPESARAANRRTEPSSSRPAGPSRDREWRPGGEHRDPRQKFKDAKKARNAEHRKRKFERRGRFDAIGGEFRFSGPHGDTGRRRVDRPDHNRPHGPRTFQKKSFAGNQDPRERPSSPRTGEEPKKEPPRREETEPTPPPRPSEPVIPAPGPPERGRFHRPRPRPQRSAKNGRRR